MGAKESKVTLKKEYEALLENDKAANALARSSNTPETKESAVASSRALSEFIAAHKEFRPKVSCYASRAGKRQHSEFSAIARAQA